MYIKCDLENVFEDRFSGRKRKPKLKNTSLKIFA